MSTQINRQNAHIANSYYRAEACIQELMKHGMTVLAARIGGRVPEIQIQPPTRSLGRPGVFSCGVDELGKYERMRSEFSDCAVIWERRP